MRKALFTITALLAAAVLAVSPTTLNNWRLLAANQGSDDFVITIETAGADTFTLPLRSGFNYDMTVDWGDGSTSYIDAHDDADITHSYSGAGTWEIAISGTCEAWYFNNGGDCALFRTVEQWGDVGFTGLGLTDAFQGCSNATDFGDEITGASGVTSLRYTWYGCSSATSFPDVNALTNVTTLYKTWLNCSSATSFPAVNALTNVTSLYQTWRNCSGATSFPDVNALTNVGTLRYTWLNCSSATSFPDVNALTNVTLLDQTWHGCNSATNFPAVNALTNVTSLYATWYNCSSATSFPDVNALTNVTLLDRTWLSCNSATNFPAVNNLTNVTLLKEAWRYCISMTNPPALFTSNSNLTDCDYAFDSIGAGLGGTVVELWDTNNFPNVTSHTDTFEGCTGLDNYDDIPNDWKGL